MNASPEINELAAALSKAQAEMEGAVKDANNPFFRSKYADLASVWDACRKPLTKHGLSVLQFPRTTFTGEPEFYEFVAKNSGETRHSVRVACTVTVITRLLHASGQFIEDEMSAILPSGDPQAVGSATTYLRRYALQSVVGVAPEDDDGEGAMKHTGAARTDAPRAETPRQPVTGPRPVTTHGKLTVTNVERKPTRKAGTTRYEVTFSDGLVAATIFDRNGQLAEAFKRDGVEVEIQTTKTQSGTDLMAIKAKKTTEREPGDEVDPGLLAEEVGF